MSRTAKRGHRSKTRSPGQDGPGTRDGASAQRARAVQSALVPPTLAVTPAGQDVCVQRLEGEPHHARRLRELGMFEGQTIRVLTSGNPLICKVGDCRFGLCQRLARCILVEPANPTAKSA